MAAIPDKIQTWQMMEPGKEGKPGVLQKTTIPMPELAEDEALVEVAGCGVCHTDLGYFYDGGSELESHAQFRFRAQQRGRVCPLLRVESNRLRVGQQAGFFRHVDAVDVVLVVVYLFGFEADFLVRHDVFDGELLRG